MSLEALIFDVDGTLADTEETHRQAFNDAFLRLELPWTWDPQLYRELLKVSGGKERLHHYVESLRIPAEEKTRLKRLVPAVHRTKTQLYSELIADGRSPPRPGVTRLLREAHEAGLSLAIASTTTGANVHALLRRHLGGAAVGRFDVVACGDQVDAKKPAPDIYGLALARLRLPASACVAFEDSANGLAAAKAAALFTVVTPTRWTAGQDFSRADLCLAGLGEPNEPLAPEEQERVGAPYLTLAALATLHARRPAADVQRLRGAAI